MHNYFGYGEYRNKKYIADVLGHVPMGGYGAVLSGFVLGYQSLNHIKNDEVKKILETAWGEGFHCYSLKRGSGLVSGVVWQITDEDLEKIKKWEFVGLWRTIEPVRITTYKNEILSALTDKAMDPVQFSQLCDGLRYEETLNPFGKKIESSLNDNNIEKIIEIRKRLQEEYTKSKLLKVNTYGNA